MVHILLEDTGDFESPLCSRGKVCDSDANLGIINETHFWVSGLTFSFCEVMEQFRYAILLLCVRQFCVALRAIVCTFLELNLAWHRPQSCWIRAGDCCRNLWDALSLRKSCGKSVSCKLTPEGCCQTHVFDRWCVGSFLDGNSLKRSLDLHCLFVPIGKVRFRFGASLSGLVVSACVMPIHFVVQVILLLSFIRQVLIL